MCIILAHHNVLCYRVRDRIKLHDVIKVPPTIPPATNTSGLKLTWSMSDFTLNRTATELDSCEAFDRILKNTLEGYVISPIYFRESKATERLSWVMRNSIRVALRHLTFPSKGIDEVT